MIIKDHKDSLNRELSLVEQKKLQWAKEREEMAKLEQYHSRLSSKYERNSIRTQLITTNTEIVQQNNNFHHKNFGMRRVRSPSLPPILDKTITRQGSNNSDQSSGYLSGSGGSNSLPPNAIDNINPFDYKFAGPTARLDGLSDKYHTNSHQENQQSQLRNDHNHKTLKKLSLTSSINDYCSLNNEAEMEFNNGHKSLTSPSSETSSITSHDIFSVSSYANSSAIDSSDNGRSSRNTQGPVWLEKSLSEARDSEEETMSISMRSVSSFLRGQNVPVDPQVLAERENKRRKALELQQAIRDQLQERENLKRMEKEKQLQLERLEEERLAKQVEMERKRLELEQNKQYEKLENERKKEENMRKALEKAALEAQLDREKKRRERAAMQSTIDETISIQKIGEKTEIFIDERSEISPTPDPDPDSAVDDGDEEDDGETVLIGTPIKLKKKNLESFRRKLQKRQQNVVDDCKTNTDDEVSTPRTTKSDIPATKLLSELDGIALVLQSMPLVPFVPFTNEMFNLNQLNNLALLMAAQNRMNSPNLMLPIISKDTQQQQQVDLSQFIIPPANQQTITLQIQQVETRPQTTSEQSQAKIQSIPPTPEIKVAVELKPSLTFDKTEDDDAQQQPPPVVPSTPVAVPPTPLPHDGTFTKEECVTQDAFTSTSTENRFVDEEREVKILTPQKYRNEVKLKANTMTVSTQTESFLFCEYCSYQHKQHHHHHCTHSHQPPTGDVENVIERGSPNENSKTKEKKSDSRPQWGVRNPPIKYLKASERDPFYGKNRKKRYLKKALSESEKTDDTCTHRDCPLVKNPPPLLTKRFEKFNRGGMLPIKTDRFGRICIMDDQHFILNETFRKIKHQEVYTSDAESSIDIKHKSFFLPKAHDFQDIFVD